MIFYWLVGNFEKMNEPYYVDYTMDDLPVHLGLKPMEKNVRSTTKKSYIQKDWLSKCRWIVLPPFVDASNVPQRDLLSTTNHQNNPKKTMILPVLPLSKRNPRTTLEMQALWWIEQANPNRNKPTKNPRP